MSDSIKRLFEVEYLGKGQLTKIRCSIKPIPLCLNDIEHGHGLVEFKDIEADILMRDKDFYSVRNKDDCVAVTQEILEFSQKEHFEVFEQAFLHDVIDFDVSDFVDWELSFGFLYPSELIELSKPFIWMGIEDDTEYFLEDLREDKHLKGLPESFFQDLRVYTGFLALDRGTHYCSAQMNRDCMDVLRDIYSLTDECDEQFCAFKDSTDVPSLSYYDREVTQCDYDLDKVSEVPDRVYATLFDAYKVLRLSISDDLIKETLVEEKIDLWEFGLKPWDFIEDHFTWPIFRAIEDGVSEAWSGGFNSTFEDMVSECIDKALVD